MLQGTFVSDLTTEKSEANATRNVCFWSYNWEEWSECYKERLFLILQLRRVKCYKERLFLILQLRRVKRMLQGTFVSDLTTEKSEANATRNVCFWSYNWEEWSECYKERLFLILQLRRVKRMLQGTFVSDLTTEKSEANATRNVCFWSYNWEEWSECYKERLFLILQLRRVKRMLQGTFVSDLTTEKSEANATRSWDLTTEKSEANATRNVCFWSYNWEEWSECYKERLFLILQLRRVKRMLQGAFVSDLTTEKSEANATRNVCFWSYNWEEWSECYKERLFLILQLRRVKRMLQGTFVSDLTTEKSEANATRSVCFWSYNWEEWSECYKERLFLILQLTTEKSEANATRSVCFWSYNWESKAKWSECCYKERLFLILQLRRVKRMLQGTFVSDLTTEKVKRSEANAATRSVCFWSYNWEEWSECYKERLFLILQLRRVKRMLQGTFVSDLTTEKSEANATRSVCFWSYNWEE